MVEEHASDQDHENALLALAVYYASYGKGPFKLRALKTIADDDLNLDVPARMDRTFAELKREGNLVVRKAADNTWKVTPSGEKWLKATYGLTKGRGTPPTGSSTTRVIPTFRQGRFATHLSEPECRRRELSTSRTY